jgi:membrane associated rhomboid family serine protease
MLLPVRQENSEVRRMPWVSIVLIALNVLVFIWQQSLWDSRGWEREMRSRIAEAQTFLETHPWVGISADFLPYCSQQFIDRYLQLNAAVEKRYVPPTQKAIDQGQMAHLVKMIELKREESPYFLWGLSREHQDAWRFETHAFFHLGLLHLVGNMFFLFLTAPFVEDVFGRPLFAVFYLGAAAVAGAVHLQLVDSNQAMLFGASGAVAGAMGAFLVRFASSRIQFLFLPIPIFWKLRFKFHLPAYFVLPLWFGWQWLQGVRGADDGNPVAYWAHVGGFAFGVLFTLLFRLSRVEQKLITKSIEAKTTLKRHPSLEKAVVALGKRDYRQALIEARRVLMKEPDNIDALEVVFQTHVDTKDLAEAAKCATRLLEISSRAAKCDPGFVERFTRQAAENLPDELPARFWSTGAAILLRHKNSFAARALLEDGLERKKEDPEIGRIVVTLAQLSQREGHPEVAKELLESGLGLPGLTEGGRQELTLLLADVGRSTGALPERGATPRPTQSSRPKVVEVAEADPLFPTFDGR